MTVTYGFYNSSNGDRKYNALQFSRLFEGIIRDGVFSTVGGSLMVVAASNLTVNISPGRAWFNNTWTNNDALLPLTLDPAEAILNRYDAIVLEVAPDERENRFKIVKGTPATTPAKPTMIKTGGIYQYPLAYIYVGKGVGSISQANISNAVGTTECPFITGALQQVTTNDIIAQWESEFNTWFDNLQAQLEGNVVTNLQNQINTKLTAAGGDGKDVVVSFTEAATEADIASGEKLSVLFGKILKMFKGKAPNSHASSDTTYGVGTTANYGHCKTINELTQSSHVNGLALSAYQGKVLNDRNKYKIVEITSTQNWTVPADVYEIDVLALGGGGGGGGGGASVNEGYNSDNIFRAPGGGGRCGGNGQVVFKERVKVTPGQVLSCVIGGAGSGGAGGVNVGTGNYNRADNPAPPQTDGANGTAGGNTTISALGITATGGKAGNGGKGRSLGTSDTTDGETSTVYGEKIYTSDKNLQSGSNGTKGGVYDAGTSTIYTDSVEPTSRTVGGVGGRGGVGTGRAVEQGANATGRGSGGGGGGGGGGNIASSSKSKFTSVQSGAEGGAGVAGMVVIGYF
jgi:hypothetical protein